jgi:hypothetical protein
MLAVRGASFKARALPPLGSPILPRATRLARFPCSSGVGSRSSSSPLAMSIMNLASWAGSREAFWPVHRSLVRWPLGQFVGPPCSCLVPAFNAQVADFTICTVRVLEWAVIGRHSVDGPATGTGIFTCIAGSHARFHGRFRGRFGGFRGHEGRISPFGPPRKSFRSALYSKGPTTNRPPHLTFLGATPMSIDATPFPSNLACWYGGAQFASRAAGGPVLHRRHRRSPTIQIKSSHAVTCRCRATAMRQKRELLKHFRLIWPVQSSSQKYFASRLTQISNISPPSRSQEGRLAIVTDAGRDAVDAKATR